MSGPNWGVSQESDWLEAEQAREYAAQEAAEAEDSDTGETNGDAETNVQGNFFGDSTGDWSWSNPA